MAGELSEHHAGDLKRESAGPKAERIITEDLRRLRSTNTNLPLRLKSDPAKLQIAETTLQNLGIGPLAFGIWHLAFGIWSFRASVNTFPDTFLTPLL